MQNPDFIATILIIDIEWCKPVKYLHPFAVITFFGAELQNKREKIG